MRFENIDAANLELNKYVNLVGVIDPLTDKKSWGIFIGVSDEIMSRLIYKGIRGELPLHSFNHHDLETIEFWAGFYDDDAIRLDKILQDEYLYSLCQPGALYKEFEITHEWSFPIRIPRGLSFRMVFAFDEGIIYKIYDLKNEGNVTEQPVQREMGINKLIRWNNLTTGIQEMKEPAISFKLANDTYMSRGISLLFSNE